MAAHALEQAEVLRALRKLYDASAPGGDPAGLERARERALRVLEDLEPGAPVERRFPAAAPAGQSKEQQDLYAALERREQARVLSPSEEKLIFVLKTSRAPVRVGPLAVLVGVGVRRTQTLVALLERRGLVARGAGGGIVAMGEGSRS